jgi:hypothetical protein
MRETDEQTALKIKTERTHYKGGEIEGNRQKAMRVLCVIAVK